MQQSSEVAAVAGTVKAAAGPDASGGPAPPSLTSHRRNLRNAVLLGEVLLV